MKLRHQCCHQCLYMDYSKLFSVFQQFYFNRDVLMLKRLKYFPLYCLESLKYSKLIFRCDFFRWLSVPGPLPRQSDNIDKTMFFAGKIAWFYVQLLTNKIFWFIDGADGKTINSLVISKIKIQVHIINSAIFCDWNTKMCIESDVKDY